VAHEKTGGKKEERNQDNRGGGNRLGVSPSDVRVLGGLVYYDQGKKGGGLVEAAVERGGLGGKSKSELRS